MDAEREISEMSARVGALELLLGILLGASLKPPIEKSVRAMSDEIARSLTVSGHPNLELRELQQAAVDQIFAAAAEIARRRYPPAE